MTDLDAPFDQDNTDGLAIAEIAALNTEFSRLWPQWRVRAPKSLTDEQVTRTLCHHIASRYIAS